MRLDVTITPTSSTVELNGVDDFTSLSVVVGGDDQSATLSRALEQWGELEDDHVWLDIAHLEQAVAAQVGNAQWKQKFSAMVDYARAHGWVDRDNRVRAHRESL
ncbi:hypothetical protein [Rhodococcus erythropolis]|jgi:hypothetical protein|uniref:Uncharacterized protein n=1 Tax=Rhodococcus erythropolis TaxID=1833 RepID=A0A0E4AAL3_RHOER|nr:hypothetical protein [Rhodococcus erythropolis]AKD99063.1 hypothetical protein XU06_22035 [Rhodococcus erythropolis]KAB2582360.1 hypothetical protein BS297_26085 [Rhodococcus erythropolis]MBF7732130.1 hypothetical protein [Rhodococcus erythropolis]MCZ4640785.1 hypothetical protein [Rhodococcus erythropolis]MDF2468880.1 hypothetical protein [Rhodococcus erythropolis]